MKAYVFDTSALIGAWVRSYPLDNFPNFWDNIDSIAQEGCILVPEEVFNELRVKEDDLLEWVRAREQWLMSRTSRAVMLEAKNILANFPGLTSPKTGKGTADPFVIATALEHGIPIVTEERGGSSRKPKIPSVCRDLEIECLSVLDLIRREGWQF